MHTLWVFKRATPEGASYCCSQHEPEHIGSGQFRCQRGGIFVDLTLTVGILIAGRELQLGESTEVVITEVA